MDIAKAIEKDAPTGTLILADSQTQGKGREGRKWSSKSAENLYFTIILRFSSARDVQQLNLAIPVAVAQSCKDFGVQDVGLKWPNDVWVKGRKICGMLINVYWLGSTAVAHAGVGVNINEDMLKNADVKDTATSVYNSIGKIVSREKFLASFCKHLESLMTQSFENVLEAYKEHDILVGKKIIVMPKKMENPERVQATAVGFSTEGNLLVTWENPQPLIAEEVTIRPQDL